MAENTRVDIEEDITQEGPNQQSPAKVFSLRQVCHDDYGRPVLYMAFAESKDNCKQGVEWNHHVAHTITYADAKNPDGIGIIVDLFGYDTEQDPDNLMEAIDEAKVGKVESRYNVKYVVVLNVQNPVTVWEDKDEEDKYKFVPKNAIEPDGGSRATEKMMKIFRDRGVPLSAKVVSWLIETRAHFYEVDMDQPADFFLHSRRWYWATPEFRKLIEKNAHDATSSFKPHPLIAAELKLVEQKSVQPHVEGERIKITEKHDALDHMKYAETLSDMLNDPQLPSPMTIGIFGNWGRGKTGLIQLLTDKLDRTGEGSGTQDVEFTWDCSRCCSVSAPCKAIIIFLLLTFVFLVTLPAFIALHPTIQTSAENATTKGNDSLPCVPVSNTTVNVKSSIGGTNDTKYTVCKQTKPPDIDLDLNKIASYIIFGVFLLVVLCILCCSCRCIGQCPSFGDIKKWLVLLFFEPKHKPDLDESNAEFIIVNFNAWEYAGSDILWAGIVTKLCDKIEEKFGWFYARFFRLLEINMNAKEYKITVGETRASTEAGTREEVMPYTYFCFPKFILLTAVVYVTLFALVLFCFVIDVSDWQWSTEKIYPLVLGLIFSGGAAALIGSFLKLSIGLWKSQKDRILKIKEKMDRQDFSKELGFMYKVKQEVFKLVSMVNYMEWLNHKKYKVVLVIDDLDRCEKTRVLKMLEAVNIILSDPGIPFISILAIDPRLVVRSIEEAMCVILLDARINGHEYLKKIIHLPFHVPALQPEKIQKMIQGRINNYKSIGARGPEPPPNENPAVERRPNNAGQEGDAMLQDNLNADGGIAEDNDVQENPVGIRMNEIRDAGNVQNEVCNDSFIISLQWLEQNTEYLAANPRNVKRITNILNVATRLYCKKMKEVTFGAHEDKVENLCKWLVLAEQWPYRVSWLVQLFEDYQQHREMEKKSGEMVSYDWLEAICEDHILLSKVYKETRKLLALPSEWKSLLSLDYDPEVFDLFLQKHQLRFEHLREFLPYTINLDLSLKETVALSIAEKKINAGVVSYSVAVPNRNQENFSFMVEQVMGINAGSQAPQPLTQV